MSVVTIHQPEYFPWLGFFHKVRQADTLVILDHVQFDRSSLQHRTRVVGPGGQVWLTIPYVHQHPQRIDELRFADSRWAVKHWKSLQAAYGRAAHWREVGPKLEAFFQVPYARVAEATEASLRLLFDAFDVRPERMVRSSELNVPGEASELVLNLCKHLGAKAYVSGRTGATYLDRAAFEAAGVEVRVQSFAFPEYPRSKPLAPEERKGLSALDAWAHAGAGAAGLIRGAA